MKQLLIATAFLFILAVAGQAQSTFSRYNGKTWEQLSGNGKLVQFNPVVSMFTNIDISHMNAQVVIETGGAEYSLNISIDDNLKDFFFYKQEGNTLKLSFDLSGGKYDRWLSSNNTVITVKVPVLESLTNSGNTKIELKQLNQKEFRLISSGNPNITLSGTVNELMLQSTGNSDINAGILIANKTILSSSGNADIIVNTKELVERNMNGNNEVSNLFTTSKEIAAAKKETGVEFVSFKLKNNSVLPAKLTLVSYRPDEQGNGTSSFVLIPYGTKSFSFPAGTKIYLADSEQVNTVMSGKKITDQPPFLVVKKEDSNKTININQ